MTKIVDISNIFSFKELLNSSYKRKLIEEYFKKKSYTPKAQDFKPQSEAWLKAKQEDNDINSLPDHNVEIKYDTLKIKSSFNEVEFQIGTITTLEIYFNEDEHGDMFRDVTRTFLVENSYWGHGLICSFEELFNHYKIQELLELMLDDQIRDRWRTNLEKFSDGVFMLLLDKIIKSEKKLISTNFYQSSVDGLYVEIGQEKYYAKDMVEINEAYKTGNYEFYDSFDKKITYSTWLHDSFVDFYLQHSPKK